MFSSYELLCESNHCVLTMPLFLIAASPPVLKYALSMGRLDRYKNEECNGGFLASVWLWASETKWKATDMPKICLIYKKMKHVLHQTWLKYSFQITLRETSKWAVELLLLCLPAGMNHMSSHAWRMPATITSNHTARHPEQHAHPGIAYSSESICPVAQGCLYAVTSACHT